MNRFRVVVCSLSLLAASLTSCVKDIVMDALEKPQVAVVCVLTDDPVQELRLFYTKGASRKDPVPVAEAEAVLLDQTLQGREVGHFVKEKDGIWKLKYAAICKHRYRLEIKVPGYEEISAEQEMPTSPVKMAAFGQYYYLIDGLNFPWSGPIPDVEGGETPPDFIPNDKEFDLPLGVKVYYIHTIQDITWMFARNYNPETGRHETALEICTDFPFVDTFNRIGDSYIPPERTDIPNPHVEGSHVARLYPHLEGRPLHRLALRVPSRDLTASNGWWLSFSGSMTGKYNCKNFYQFFYGDLGSADPLSSDEGFLEADAVSEDLDRYLLDAYYKQELKASSDLSTIYLRDNLYTNVSGGVGLFGAACIRKFQWSGDYEYVDDGRDHLILTGPDEPAPESRHGECWPSFSSFNYTHHIYPFFP